MAFTRIDDKKVIEFDNTIEFPGGSGAYFHFEDLEIIRKQHPDAEAFKVMFGKIDDKECMFLTLVGDLTTEGAQLFFERDGHHVALSCPPIRDTQGGKNYDDIKDSLV